MLVPDERFHSLFSLELENFVQAVGDTNPQWAEFALAKLWTLNCLTDDTRYNLLYWAAWEWHNQDDAPRMNQGERWWAVQRVRRLLAAMWGG